MSVQSISSGNQIYTQTTVMQQRVAYDRANVIESEKELSDNQAQLDKDLTYLSDLQRKSHGVQQLENKHAQSNAINQLDKKVQSIPLSPQAIKMAQPSNDNILGSLINIVA